MRGAGRGSGWGRGLGMGMGMGAGGSAWGGRGAERGQGALPLQAPAGYRYVGTCRCGFGPNAYYQDMQGRVTPGAALFSEPVQVPGEVERLRAEKVDLERRLGALEDRLRNMEGES